MVTFSSPPFREVISSVCGSAWTATGYSYWFGVVVSCFDIRWGCLYQGAGGTPLEVRGVVRSRQNGCCTRGSMRSAYCSCLPGVVIAVCGRAFQMGCCWGCPRMGAVGKEVLARARVTTFTICLGNRRGDGGAMRGCIHSMETF